METCKQNAMYKSKEIQNQIIIICGDVIRNKLLDNIRKAKFFAVIADEVTDSSNSEQLSISFRFVENGVPQEKFLGFKRNVYLGLLVRLLLIPFYLSFLTGS